MKKNLHPEIYEITATCACGHVLNTISTKESISKAICKNCHPFYTGDQKFLDAAGRIEKFNKKYAAKK